jgi:lipopolysaccharide transport system ATP-binding protein
MSITVDRVSKRYWLQPGPPATFQDAVRRVVSRIRQPEPFWALRDVSFQVAPGDAIALLGRNGAGKSTLLRLVCGLARPTTGTCRVEGAVAALLELGAGFHPQLTGRENLYVAGVVSGLRRREVAARFDEIVAFAEIRQFIDQPLRTYSTGMKMRLAFSVAIHTEPDILVIDEVLAVGDAAFQAKCADRIHAFLRRGKSLLLVSHNLDHVRTFCSRAIWLERGRGRADGPSLRVAEAYRADVGHAGPRPSLAVAAD